jgi:uncharacterized membrane protein YsdA (DUF1294 family)
MRPPQLLVLALLLALPGLAVWRLATPPAAAAIGIVLLLASTFTYAFYAWDKHRSRTGQWRIPERMLHVFEFMGGWPGAFLAQRRLRHKTAKTAFLVPFWLIVAAHNTLALDALLDWRLSRSAADAARSWFESATSAPSAKPDSPPPRSTIY